MKYSNVLIAVALIGGGTLISPSAQASFISVSLHWHTTFTAPSGEKSVYRVYANFTHGSDRVVAWGGSATIGSTMLSTGPCTNGNYFQAGGSNLAPSQAVIDKIPLAQWDTFATIGVNIAEQGIPYDQTILTPGFPTFINGNQLTITDKLVFVPNDSPQAQADFAGDGDAQLRVLLMQLTVSEDEIPFGHVSLQWKTATSPVQTVSNYSWVPLEAIGRCCLPAGECIILPHSYCAQFYNGYFLGCDPCDACELTCAADAAPHPGDGVVNVDDLLAVINAWGPCQPFNPCPPDVAPEPFGNGVVDVDDLLAVINAWGPCK